jgi:serine/threonine protein phosphatase PrpC
VSSDVTIPVGLRFASGREWSAATFIGPGKPDNADGLSAGFEGPLLGFAVADGVGAMPASPTASALASIAATNWIAARTSLVLDDVKALYDAASAAVGAGLKRQGEPGATTLVVAVVSGGQAIVASLGDTEVLAVPADGPAVSLLPRDHHPTQTNMLLAWLDGIEHFESHSLSLGALPYRLVLATDGVAGTLTVQQIADITRASPPSEAAVALVMRARAAGSHDDATAIVMSDQIEIEAREGSDVKVVRLNSLPGDETVEIDPHITQRKPR